MPAERIHQIKCPLPTNAAGESPLILRFLRAREGLSSLFEYDVQLLSEQDDIDPSKLLGKSLTVSVRVEDNRKRHFNGIVASFAYQGRAEGYSQYHAVLRPWLWLLTRHADCRIFQEKKVDDIFRNVCNDTHGFSDFRLVLSDEYRERDYCVQYRESDYAFLSRLLEEEGIFYYFEHSEDKHTLVLVDGNSALKDVPGEKKVVFRAPGEARVGLEHISSWRVGHQVQTGAYVLDDYDFTKPRVDLEGRAAKERQHAHADYEAYDYPGLHWEAADGEKLARIRLEELQSQHRSFGGVADNRGFSPGLAFELSEYPRASENSEYILESVDIEVESAEIEHFRGEAENRFDVSFTAFDRQEPYRPRRTTPKPFVRGPQTAVVVGKKGEEIWTDKYGRVKLQFHWDRESQADEKSSCWVRVSQTWAGKNWGAMHIPRIGQEVIVDFLEGDPDRPLVTGRVYNDAQMPPYPLPDNQTQSGLLSRSTKNGSPDHANELRFEDKKEEEHVYFHAERDFERVVENDDVLKVGLEKKSPGNQSIEIHGNRTAEVKTGNDETTVKQGNHALDVKAGKSDVTAAQKITLKVGASTITIEPAKISIVSPQIEISGQAKVAASAPTVDVNGSGLLKLAGGVIKIN